MGPRRGADSPHRGPRARGAAATRRGRMRRRRHRADPARGRARHPRCTARASIRATSRTRRGLRFTTVSPHAARPRRRASRSLSCRPPSTRPACSAGCTGRRSRRRSRARPDTTASAPCAAAIARHDRGRGVADRRVRAARHRLPARSRLPDVRAQLRRAGRRRAVHARRRMDRATASASSSTAATYHDNDPSFATDRRRSPAARCRRAGTSCARNVARPRRAAGASSPPTSGPRRRRAPGSVNGRGARHLQRHPAHRPQAPGQLHRRDPRYVAGQDARRPGDLLHRRPARDDGPLRPGRAAHASTTRRRSCSPRGWIPSAASSSARATCRSTPSCAGC